MEVPPPRTRRQRQQAAHLPGAALPAAALTAAPSCLLAVRARRGAAARRRGWQRWGWAASCRPEVEARPAREAVARSQVMLVAAGEQCTSLGALQVARGCSSAQGHRRRGAGRSRTKPSNRDGSRCRDRPLVAPPASNGRSMAVQHGQHRAESGLPPPIQHIEAAIEVHTAVYGPRLPLLSTLPAHPVHRHRSPPPGAAPAPATRPASRPRL